MTYFSSDISTMDEDDLVSYRQYTVNATNTNRGGGKKRPAPPTTTDPYDHTSVNPKQRVSSLYTQHKNL